MSAGLRAKTSLSLTVTRPFQILQAAATACGLGTRPRLGAGARDRGGGLKTAHPAFAVLGVRLEQPYRAAVALAALVVLVELVADELVDLARLQLGDGGALERLEELRVARNEPPVEERGADGVVLTGRLETLLERARGVARFEPGVPEGAVEALADQLP